MTAFLERKEAPGYVHVATLEEVQGNDFNLNIPRYVSKHREEEEIAIAGVQKEIEVLEAELAKKRQEMARYLKELGLGG